MQNTPDITNEFIFNYLVKMNNKVDGIATDVSTLKSDVTTLKSDVSTLKSDVSGIKSVMATKQDVENLAIATAKGFAETHKRVDNLNEKIDDVEKTMLEQIESTTRTKLVYA